MKKPLIYLLWGEYCCMLEIGKSGKAVDDCYGFGDTPKQAYNDWKNKYARKGGLITQGETKVVGKMLMTTVVPRREFIRSVH